MSKKDKDLAAEEKSPDKSGKTDNRSNKTSDKKVDKNKNPNFFVRIGRKLKETFSELKRVTWPSLPKAVKATGVVLVIVLIFTLLVTGFNYGFKELLDLITGG